MNKLQITFIHELGHHIANELNAKVFGFDRTTESILLYPSSHGNFFDGETKTANTIVDHYEPENTPLEYIRIFYGCLFESLFRQIEIGKCLCESASKSDINNNLCKGRADYQQMAQMSIIRNVNNRFEWYRYLTVEYFKFMKENINDFRSVFHLNVFDFILEQESNYYKIDLDRLNPLIQPFLINHQNDFKMAVERLRFLTGH